MAHAQEYAKHLKKYPELLTVKHLCNALCGVSSKYAYALLRENRIRHIRVGRKIYIPKSAVAEYLASLEN